MTRAHTRGRRCRSSSASPTRLPPHAEGAQRGRELRAGELRYQWGTLAGDSELALRALDVSGVVQRLRRMQVGPLRGRLQDRRLVGIRSRPVSAHLGQRAGRRVRGHPS